jgi:protein SCO1/2
MATVLLDAGTARGTMQSDRILQAVDFRQTIGTTVPLDARFTDADGNRVTLRAAAAGQPAVLLLAWYNCDNLCPLTLHDLAESLARSKFRVGSDFRVIVVSIDPREGPDDATRVREQLRARYGSPEADSGWRVLTGDDENIGRLADSIGYEYTYDPVHDQYAHPAGITFLTAAGEVSGYLFGLKFADRDLRLALTAAGEGRLGSPIDRLVLRCCDFDPTTGTYTLSILRVLNALCIVTVILVLLGVAVLSLRRGGSRGQEHRAEGGARE